MVGTIIAIGILENRRDNNLNHAEHYPGCKVFVTKIMNLVFIPTPGTFTSCLLPPAGIAGTYFYKPAPPISKFVGKTPEYVSVYTSTYKSKRGSIQAGMTSAGCLTGCVV